MYGNILTKRYIRTHIRHNTYAHTKHTCLLNIDDAACASRALVVTLPRVLDDGPRAVALDDDTPWLFPSRGDVPPRVVLVVDLVGEVVPSTELGPRGTGSFPSSFVLLTSDLGDSAYAYGDSS